MDIDYTLLYPGSEFNCFNKWELFVVKILKISQTRKNKDLLSIQSAIESCQEEQKGMFQNLIYLLLFN